MLWFQAQYSLDFLFSRKASDAYIANSVCKKLESKREKCTAEENEKLTLTIVNSSFSFAFTESHGLSAS